MASEPYGLVEETRRYLRMDGETPAGRRSAQPGQIVVLDGAGAGHARRHPPLRLRRHRAAGRATTSSARAEITTRDIDRGEYPHFLLKEIGEAPESFRKTLRGKLDEHDGTLRRGARARDAARRDRASGCATGTIRRVLVIGQGTAAVAGQASPPRSTARSARHGCVVGALPATELSGFALATT